MNRINPVWMKQVEEQIASNEPFNIVVNSAPASKWLTFYLAKLNRAFKVVNLGCGVKRFIDAENEVCPACKKKL